MTTTMEEKVCTASVCGNVLPMAMETRWYVPGARCPHSRPQGSERSCRLDVSRYHSKWTLPRPESLPMP